MKYDTIKIIKTIMYCFIGRRKCKKSNKHILFGNILFVLQFMNSGVTIRFKVVNIEKKYLRATIQHRKYLRKVIEIGMRYCVRILEIFA